MGRVCTLRWLTFTLLPPASECPYTLLLHPHPPHTHALLQQDHLDIRVIPSFQEVEKEDRGGEKHTMTAVKLQVVVEKV